MTPPSHCSSQRGRCVCFHVSPAQRKTELGGKNRMRWLPPPFHSILYAHGGAKERVLVEGRKIDYPLFMGLAGSLGEKKKEKAFLGGSS